PVERRELARIYQSYSWCRGGVLPRLERDWQTAAWAAVRTKGSYFQAQFQHLRARRGPKKAIIAVAASMLTAAYHILRDGVPDKDLGSEQFTRRNKEHAAKRLK